MLANYERMSREVEQYSLFFRAYAGLSYSAQTELTICIPICITTQDKTFIKGQNDIHDADQPSPGPYHMNPIMCHFNYSSSKQTYAPCSNI